MTEPRVPEASDFPRDAVVDIVLPKDKSKPVSNILILLHGLGDSHAPFAALGAQFNFPETACLAVRAPLALPFNPNGYHWGDDLIFDTSTGGLDMMGSTFNASHKLMKEIIDDVLVGKCGWKRRAIFLFGFGQGGVVALDVATQLPVEGPDAEFGGVVSLGGPLHHSAPSPAKKFKTPILVMGAEKNTAITTEAAQRLKNVFEFVEIVNWKGRKEDGMMKNAEEAMPMMRFMARRLRSRAGIPKGAIELS
jgi:predicted esterase